jgi:hypothetical protein
VNPGALSPAFLALSAWPEAISSALARDVVEHFGGWFARKLAALKVSLEGIEMVLKGHDSLRWIRCPSNLVHPLF